MEKKKRVRSRYELDRMKEYLKEYRRKNPEKVKQWRNNYIIAKAQKLLAEQEREKGA